MPSNRSSAIHFTRRSLALGLAAPVLFAFQPAGCEALERSLYAQATTALLLPPSPQNAG